MIGVFQCILKNVRRLAGLSRILEKLQNNAGEIFTPTLHCQ